MKFEVQQLDATVFPSEEKTVVVAIPEGDQYGGAHAYWITNCLGFQDGQTLYQYRDQDGSKLPVGHKIQFVQKNDDGSVIPGVQSEQLAIVMMDRCKKLNARFPSAQNEKMIQGLQMFLDACRERVEERMNRGVMGKLQK